MTPRQLPPLSLRLRPSISLARIITVLHLTGGIIVLLTPLPWAWQALLLAYAVYSGVRAWRQHIPFPHGISGIFVRADGALEVQRHGGMHTVWLHDAPVVTAQLIVLRLRFAEAAPLAALILLPDASDADSLRQLRVLLRFADLGPAADSVSSTGAILNFV